MARKGSRFEGDLATSENKQDDNADCLVGCILLLFHLVCIKFVSEGVCAVIDSLRAIKWDASYCEMGRREKEQEMLLCIGFIRAMLKGTCWKIERN